MNCSRDFTAALLLAFSLTACDTAEMIGPSGEEAALANDELVSVFAEAAASVEATTDSVTAARAEEERGKSRGGSLFDRLAAEIPGFGGLYRTQRCTVAVVLTAEADKDHALRVVHTALETLVGRACADGIRVFAVRGDFTYLELKSYLRAARPLFTLDGVYGAHISYQQNRLVITVASRSVATRVLEVLPRLGIPERAVVFKGGSANQTRDEA